jgi:hypothetical protein
MTWEDIGGITEDSEMLKVFRQCFDDGRLPIFEKLEQANKEPLVQMTHLSFQELMAGEYAAAVVRYACREGLNVRAYVNFFTSSSSKSLNRDRLSQQWWAQVWFHVCEMLDASNFGHWCDVLAEDERAHLRVGSHGYLWHMTTAMKGAWSDKKQVKKKSIGLFLGMVVPDIR